MLPSSEISRFYESHVRRYGYDYRALGYGQRSSQERRFAAVAQIGDFDGKRVLDMGCGFGDLLSWMEMRGARPRYTGVDICPLMIEHCRERFAGSEASFEVGDALAWSSDTQYDYVVASGIFGYGSADARTRVEPTLARLFGFSRIGLVANFLSERAETRAAARLYLQPSELLHYAFTLTPAVRLDHTYMPNDFTLLLYRTPSWKEQAS